MYRFEHTQHLAAPLETLVTFFSDVAQLDSSTPSYFKLSLTEGDPSVPLFQGQRFRYRFAIFGVPFAWTTEITEVAAERFVDVQRQGPYRSFQHTHLFLPTAEGTMMIDTVVYSLWFGPLNGLANGLVVRPLLDGIFAFRRGAAAERFGEVDAKQTPRL